MVNGEVVVLFPAIVLGTAIGWLIDQWWSGRKLEQFVEQTTKGFDLQGVESRTIQQGCWKGQDRVAERIAQLDKDMRQDVVARETRLLETMAELRKVNDRQYDAHRNALCALAQSVNRELVEVHPLDPTKGYRHWEARKPPRS